jgi:hypothetical protein
MSQPLFNATLAARFWPKVDKSADCWLWTASVRRDGYGQINRGGASHGSVAAHRVAWFLTHGEWPALSVCHRCDNRRCVNPTHLFLGTAADNSRDMASKGRSAIQRHPELADRCLRCPSAKRFRKLSESDRVTIIAEYQAGATTVALARRFGVTSSHISKIGRGL